MDTFPAGAGSWNAQLSWGIGAVDCEARVVGDSLTWVLYRVELVCGCELRSEGLSCTWRTDGQASELLREPGVPTLEVWMPGLGKYPVSAEGELSDWG